MKALALNLLKEDTKRGLKVFIRSIYCLPVRQRIILTLEAELALHHAGCKHRR